MNPGDCLYSKEHEWIRAEGGIGTVGITDFAQKELGDVVFVELPPVGRKLRAGETFGSVESVKAVSDIYSPVSGEVTEVNPALGEEPELVNQDPYGRAWLVKVRLADPSELQGLMTAEAYSAFTGGSK